MIIQSLRAWEVIFGSSLSLKLKKSMFFNLHSLIHLIIRYTTHNAAAKFQIIDTRYAELGRQVRTVRFANGVVKLSMNASKDIAALLSYLPFILNGLIGILPPPPPPPPHLFLIP